MSMPQTEAKRIALDKAGKHSAATWDLAAKVCDDAGEPALRQLCEIKVALARFDRTCIADRIMDALDIGN